MEALLFDIDAPTQASTCQAVGGADNSRPSEPAAALSPLPARLRPRHFDEFVGQGHILSKGKLLRRAIDSDTFSSLILCGPPGVGKTSLSELIASTTHSEFVRLSGVASTVADIRRETARAADRRRINGRRTILFVDELHRFNRAQQDVLLPDVESGVIRFIGATTQNPYFYVISPLISRSLVFKLEPLVKEDIVKLLGRAVVDERGFGAQKIRLAPEAAEFWAQASEGDARRALNALDIAVRTSEPDASGTIVVDLSAAEASIQEKALSYGDDGHYDTASAFIKSMRGSDPDAAVYWLAKMLKAGEDIRFIARRIVIFASEDIGNADPAALQVATSAMQAVEMIGMPEAKLVLSQAVTYCATSPKSNASCVAICEALDDIEHGRLQPVPLHLRDSHYKGAKKMGHGEGYQYPHNHEGNFVVQDYMGVNKTYYRPTEWGHERKIRERLEYWRGLRGCGSAPATTPVPVDGGEARKQ